ncbi:MAG: T9SS type A sorting domain-containing protein [Brumimicrobium sp.]|nr:T9SS type A sorting domain-containing protein [Brumimicrobium sp.]
MKKKLLIGSLLFTTTLFGQLSMEWIKSTNPGSGDVNFNDVAEMADGGSIAVGCAYHDVYSDLPATGYQGGKDILIQIRDADGNIDYEDNTKNYYWGGTKNEEAYRVKKTSDGGFIICGYSTSVIDGQGNIGYKCGLVIKLDNQGQQEWFKLRKIGSYDFEIRDIIENMDGSFTYVGYVQTGTTPRLYVAKLDTDGSIIWSNTYFNGSQYYRVKGYSIAETSDGDFIVLGSSDDMISYSGQVSGDYDLCLIHLSSSGAVISKKGFGGSGVEKFAQIQRTSDNNFVIIGTTTSNNEAFSMNTAGNMQVYVLKVDADLTKLSLKTFGGSLEEYVWDTMSFVEEADGKLTICADTKSNNGNVVGSQGERNIWIFRISANGNVLYSSNCFGGSNLLYARGFTNLSTGGYLIVGADGTNDNYWQGYTMKINENTSGFDINMDNAISIYPNPTRNILHVEGLEKSEKFVLTNMLGQEMMRISLDENNSKFSMETLPNGIYFLRNSDLSISKKIIKE